jgi:ribosomal protein S17E
MTIKHSPRIDQQVDTIKNLVEKYITIVIKNVKDRVPKVITWLVIKNVNEYIDQQLVAHFYEKNMVVSVEGNLDF